jgi:hypothetical protein
MTGYGTQHTWQLHDMTIASLAGGTFAAGEMGRRLPLPATWPQRGNNVLQSARWTMPAP